jgi:RNA polymerase sigma-70 factor (ECF subfamily)
MPELVMALDPVNTQATTFDALYRANAADLFSYVMTLLRDRGAAEDATMAAFERAFRHRRAFDRRRGSERAWLFGIARNAALDELRRRRRAVPAAGEPADTGEHDEADPLVRATVRAALAGLDPRERELVALKFVAGLTHAEIAEVLGISAGNAATRLHRVILKLREACHA